MVRQLFRNFAELCYGPSTIDRRAEMPRFSRLFVFSLLATSGCSGSEIGPGTQMDPLATVGGFCQMWAEAACNDDVVDACAASDVAACVDSQSDFCESLVPAQAYVKDNAMDCLGAVKNAYKDADLSSEELAVVRRLAAPCDRLFRGPEERGDACAADRDCDTVAGFRCVVKGDGDEGSCEEPVSVAGGRSCERAEQVCEEDFYCDGAHCVEKLGENATCAADVECADVLRCSSDAGAGGAGGADGAEPRCVLRAETTEACEVDEDCQSRVCARARGAESGVCVEAVRLSVSEPVCEDLR